MFKKIIYTFALLFISFQCITAQSNAKAERIISDILANANVNAIKTNFKLAMADKRSAQTQNMNGTFTLKGSKFALEMNAMTVFFNGKTQWSYVPQSNEVSITEPSEKELSEINPMAILSGFKSKCSIRFAPGIKSAQNYCIEMIPRTKNKDISKIDVQVNKINNNLFSIKLNNRNGSYSLLTLSNFQKGVKVSDSNFVFNAARYKGVEVNDLR